MKRGPEGPLLLRPDGWAVTYTFPSSSASPLVPRELPGTARRSPAESTAVVCAQKEMALLMTAEKVLRKGRVQITNSGEFREAGRLSALNPAPAVRSRWASVRALQGIL